MDRHIVASHLWEQYHGDEREHHISEHPNQMKKKKKKKKKIRIIFLKCSTKNLSDKLKLL